MSIANDLRNFMNDGELPEDSFKYAEVDPEYLNILLEKCYIFAIVRHRKYLEMVFRNLEDQTAFYCLHIYNPSFIEITGWKVGDDGAKYIIDPTKM